MTETQTNIRTTIQRQTEPTEQPHNVLVYYFRQEFCDPCMCVVNTLVNVVSFGRRDGDQHRSSVAGD